ncbi:MAG: hypothetical protein K0Q95_3110 [Bacteroidota bacterium]|nr:hypothetical protein [Bacteroidota bacterium]
MRKIFSLVILVSSVLMSCKSKKAPLASATASESNTASPVTNTATSSGKVSHKYRASGCSTVIILMQDETELTLIPKDKLPSEMDVDGLEVKFNYRTLRMAQPEGCTTGQPAEITDLSKK